MLNVFFPDPRLIRSKYVCEFDVMHLACSPPAVLEIQAADFGGSAAIICGNGEESYQLCKLMDKTETVKTRCDGKSQCYISALRAIFGDPCLGLSKQAHTSIYLNVIYACGKFSLPDRACAQLLISGIVLKRTLRTISG